MEEQNNPEIQPSYRKLKKIYSRIKKQMEFYFSDSNLVKDKFLSELISKDPDGYVPLEVFKRFNKIKAISNNCEVIAASVARSDMFELSKDHKKVRRITPVDRLKDFDACTLYVEKLPQYADQKWIKDVLGHLGTIRYVNVPRFKASNRIKGFAFVEFESPDDVKRVCEYYTAASEKESSSSEEERKNIKNAKNYKHEENMNNKKIKKGKTGFLPESSEKLTDFSSLKSNQNEVASDKDLESEKNHLHEKGKRKRKREDSTFVLPTKKSKESDTDDHKTLNECDNELKIAQSPLNCETMFVEKPKEQMEMDNGISNEATNDENETNLEESKTKRKRKHTKRHRSSAEKPALRVMPKSEWKNYRNKYLDLQRTTMSLLKKQILMEAQELKEQEGHGKSMDSSEPKKSLHFIPSVIIKVKLTEPVKNSSETKNQVKANAIVAYIEAPVDSNEIFIRCHNSEEAQVIVKEEKLSHLGKIELLQGDEEKKYWEKIESDRKNVLNNPVRHKKRGREKLLAKAAKLEEMKNKHIYFDE